MYDDQLDIPEFLQLTPEQRAAGWALNPPRPSPSTARPLTEMERVLLAEKQRKAIEQHNRGYDMGRKLAEMSPEDKKLRKAKRKLRRARRGK